MKNSRTAKPLTQPRKIKNEGAPVSRAEFEALKILVMQLIEGPRSFDLPIDETDDDPLISVGEFRRATKLSETYVRDRILKMKGVESEKIGGRRFIRVKTLPPRLSQILKGSESGGLTTPTPAIVKVRP